MPTSIRSIINNAIQEAGLNGSAGGSSSPRNTIRTPVIFDYIHGVEDFPDSIMNNRDVQHTQKTEDGEVAKMTGKVSGATATAQQKASTATTGKKAVSINPPHASPAKKPSVPAVKVSPDYNPDPVYQNRLVANSSIG